MTDHDDAPERVGYKKPPRATRFKPGQSGNPKGRPKGAKNFATAIDAELRACVAVSENGRRRKITKREAVAKQLVDKAVAGDPKAIPTLLNEARHHEKTAPAEGPVAVFGAAEDQKVIENIIKRIRSSTGGPQ